MLRDKTLQAELENRIWKAMMLSEERKPHDLIELYLQVIKEEALFKLFDEDSAKFVGLSSVRQNQ